MFMIIIAGKSVVALMMALMVALMMAGDIFVDKTRRALA